MRKNKNCYSIIKAIYNTPTNLNQSDVLTCELDHVCVENKISFRVHGYFLN